ncbi:MAG: hypothetical protein IJG33_07865, partial [Selenomonadaceae bacterium]|nr:hypothetical protein [Selenomonadaceae bacterium]
METLSKIFWSPWGGASIVFAGILFAVYGWFCVRKVRNLNKEIERVLEAQDIAAALNESES